MSDNPFARNYQTPQSPNPYQPQQPQPSFPSENPLKPPAIILLVLASLWLLFSAVSGAVNIANGPPEVPADAKPGFAEGQVIGFYGTVILMPVCALITIIGSIQMIRLSGYPLAVTAAVLSMVPCCSSCFVVGIPFGIWAFVLLLRDDVRTRFD